MEKDWESVLAGLPTASGVYLMKDSAGKVIYVGKAVNLRSRVRSYFRDGADARPGVAVLMKHLADIEVIITDTEKEAILLENSLIKKHRPKYNIHFRDDKDFLSLRITTKEKFPRLVTLRRPDNSGEPTFGPYSSAHELRQTIKIIRGIFPIRTCKPSEFRRRTRPCINYQLKKCLAPCVGLVSEEEYAGMIANVKRFFSGKIDEILADLKEKMKKASDALEYESAARYRDQIRAVEYTLERQKVVKYGGVDKDVVAFERNSEQGVACRIRFSDGKLSSASSYFVKIPGRTDAEAVGEIIKGLYANDPIPPSEILINIEPDEKIAIEEWLSEKRNGKVVIRTPLKGESRQLIEMAEKNAREALERSLKHELDREAIFEELATKLKIAKEPTRIECVDISNLGGKFSVGSLVVFENGVAEKSKYRRYKIKTLEETPNDYLMMKEVLERRLKRGMESNDLPDLLLLDGGKGQLNIARKVLAELGIPHIAIAGIAKEREGKSNDKIYIPARKNPVTLSPQAINLLSAIRDEAHRFAISYHRNLRKKNAFSSSLLQIPGIGARKSKALLKKFGSVERIAKASPQELCATEGITEKDAIHIAQFFAEKKL